MSVESRGRGNALTNQSARPPQTETSLTILPCTQFFERRGMPDGGVSIVRRESTTCMEDVTPFAMPRI